MDVSGNPVAVSTGNPLSDSAADITPPTVLSATYNTDTRVLTATFSEILHERVNTHEIRAGDSIGNSVQFSLRTTAHDGSIITASLAPTDQETYFGTSPKLFISADAVTDLADNSIIATSIPITLTANSASLVSAEAAASNEPPTVDAGFNQVVTEGSPVTLSGTASDADSDALTYSWSHNQPGLITLSGNDTLSPSFTAPHVDSDTTVTFTLTVSDGTNEVSDSLDVIIANSNTVPVESQVTPPGPREIGGLTLTSTQSGTIQITWDAPGETPRDYRVAWAEAGENFLPRGDPAGNAFPTSPGHTVTDLEEGEEYKVKVRARYGDGNPGGWSDAYTVTVAGTAPDQPANNPPVADAGDSQTVQEGSTVALSGTASDPDGDTMTYLWSHGSALDITFSDPSSLTASFAAPQVDSNTTITITLAVSDGNTTTSDSVDVTVADVPAQVPPPGSREIGGLTLSSTQSGTIQITWDAPGETPRDYRVAWAKAGESFLPRGDPAGNAFPTSPGHTVTDLDEGEEYKVKVRARYGDGNPGGWSDIVTITVARTE